MPIASESRIPSSRAILAMAHDERIRVHRFERRERVLDRLIAEGIVTPSRQPKRRASKPIKAKGTVSDLVGEQRR